MWYMYSRSAATWYWPRSLHARGIPATASAKRQWGASSWAGGEVGGCSGRKGRRAWRPSATWEHAQHHPTSLTGLLLSPHPGAQQQPLAGLAHCRPPPPPCLQGYLSCNRFGQIIGFSHAGITAEGDNRVLFQKVGLWRCSVHSVGLAGRVAQWCLAPVGAFYSPEAFWQAVMQPAAEAPDSSMSMLLRCAWCAPCYVTACTRRPNRSAPLHWTAAL